MHHSDGLCSGGTHDFAQCYCCNMPTGTVLGLRLCGQSLIRMCSLLFRRVRRSGNIRKGSPHEAQPRAQAAHSRRRLHHYFKFRCRDSSSSSSRNAQEAYRHPDHWYHAQGPYSSRSAAWLHCPTSGRDGGWAQQQQRPQAGHKPRAPASLGQMRIDYLLGSTCVFGCPGCLFAQGPYTSHRSAWCCGPTSEQTANGSSVRSCASYRGAACAGYNRGWVQQQQQQRPQAGHRHRTAASVGHCPTAYDGLCIKQASC